MTSLDNPYTNKIDSTQTKHSNDIQVDNGRDIIIGNANIKAIDEKLIGFTKNVDSKFTDIEKINDLKIDNLTKGVEKGFETIYSQIRDLKIAVEVGFVVGTIPQMIPTGSAIVIVPRLSSSSKMPHVFSSLYLL